MLDLSNFFTKGLKNTVQIKDNSGFSHNGPWIALQENTVIDRWYIGDFCSAEYTISIDHDSHNREILKCATVATVDKANLSVFSRANTNIDIVNVTALVNNSFIDIILTPAKNNFIGSKISFTVNYFNAQTPLIV